jgi:hypothetical protein
MKLRDLLSSCNTNETNYVEITNPQQSVLDTMMPKVILELTDLLTFMYYALRYTYDISIFMSNL